MSYYLSDAIISQISTHTGQKISSELCLSAYWVLTLDTTVDEYVIPQAN